MKNPTSQIYLTFERRDVGFTHKHNIFYTHGTGTITAQDLLEHLVFLHKDGTPVTMSYGVENIWFANDTVVIQPNSITIASNTEIIAYINNHQTLNSNSRLNTIFPKYIEGIKIYKPVDVTVTNISTKASLNNNEITATRNDDGDFDIFFKFNKDIKDDGFNIDSIRLSPDGGMSVRKMALVQMSDPLVWKLTANASFTVDSADVFCVGGGGGGGTGSASAFDISGSGGNGGAVETRYGIKVVPGTQIDVIVGSGGRMDDKQKGQTASGTASSFGNYISAAGGAGGLSNPNITQPTAALNSSRGGQRGDPGGFHSTEAILKAGEDGKECPFYQTNLTSVSRNGVKLTGNVNNDTVNDSLIARKDLRYGAAGAGADSANFFVSTTHQLPPKNPGGKTGGGASGSGTSQSAASNGQNAFFFGGGGGGGCYTIENNTGKGGNGRSGIVIIRACGNIDEWTENGKWTVPTENQAESLNLQVELFRPGMNIKYDSTTNPIELNNSKYVNIIVEQ